MKRCTLLSHYFERDHNHRFLQFKDDIFHVVQETPLTISNGPLTLQCKETDVRRITLQREITYK